MVRRYKLGSLRFGDIVGIMDPIRLAASDAVLATVRSLCSTVGNGNDGRAGRGAECPDNGRCWRPG